jgi:hypothetical protein
VGRTRLRGVFACLAGTARRRRAFEPDFNGIGVGTDADIEAFFRVLAEGRAEDDRGGILLVILLVLQLET